MRQLSRDGSTRLFSTTRCGLPTMASSVAYLFGSGWAFFLGAGLVLFAVALGTRPWWSRFSALPAILGSIVAVLSATPLPIWFYIVALSLTVSWLVASRYMADRPRWRRHLFSSAVALIWLIAIFVELPYQFLPHVERVAARHIDLFGDSISAGIGGRDADRWPNVLGREHRIDIANHASAGATVADMRRRANTLDLGDDLVLLEIGGNDVLGTTTPEDFDRDLDALLSRVCDGRRQVLMFELPLPPMRNQFGQVQRHLASKHRVRLIPKRVLMAVLTAGGATVDSLHLSQPGNALMAEVVWKIIEPAFAE